MSSFLKNLQDFLGACGVQPGATLMVHADLAVFGLERGPDRRLKHVVSAPEVYAVLRDFLGESGTLIVPCFSYSWTRGEIFDPENSASVLGSLSEFVRRLPGAVRSLHPLMSLCAVGPQAQRLMKCGDDSSFGAQSIYAALHSQNVYQLMLGTHKNSVNDYAQTIFPVPYRYTKFFSGERADLPGQTLLARHSVRFQSMGDDLKTTWEALSADLKDRFVNLQISETYLHGISTQNLVSLIHEQLRRDPFSFQINPQYVPQILAIHDLHAELASTGLAHFAMNVQGIERWFYRDRDGKIWGLPGEVSLSDADWMLQQMPMSLAQFHQQRVPILSEARDSHLAQIAERFHDARI